MTSSLRLSLCVLALTPVLSLVGCSKPAAQTTPPAGTTPQTGASMYPSNPAGAQAQPGANSGDPGANARNQALNDPNVPENVKAQIRQQMGGR